MASLRTFITRKLKLRVHPTKSCVADAWKREFLGFRLTSVRTDHKRSIAPVAVARFKDRIRAITRRSRGRSLKQVVSERTLYIRGWIGYFGFCEARSALRDLDSWIRRRLRCFIWKRWKTFRRRRRGLMERGIAEAPASQTAARSRGCWSTSNVPPLRYAFPQGLLRRVGSAPDVCSVARSTGRTAVYGPVCTVVWEGGSREAPPYPYHRDELTREAVPEQLEVYHLPDRGPEPTEPFELRTVHSLIHQEPLEAVPREAPVVVRRLVRRPHARHGEDQASTRAQNAHRLAKRALRTWHVLEHLRGDHNVEALIRDGNCLGCCHEGAARERFPAIEARVRGHGDPTSFAGACEQLLREPVLSALGSRRVAANFPPGYSWHSIAPAVARTVLACLDAKPVAPTGSQGPPLQRVRGRSASHGAISRRAYTATESSNQT
jgi:hypothetical protein